MSCVNKAKGARLGGEKVLVIRAVTGSFVYLKGKWYFLKNEKGDKGRGPDIWGK